MKTVVKKEAKAGKNGGTPSLELVFADPLGLGADILVGHVTKFVNTKYDKHPYKAYVLKNWPKNGFPVWELVGYFWFKPGDVKADIPLQFGGGKPAALAAIVAAAKAAPPLVSKKETECP